MIIKLLNNHNNSKNNILFIKICSFIDTILFLNNIIKNIIVWKKYYLRVNMIIFIIQWPFYQHLTISKTKLFFKKCVYRLSHHAFRLNFSYMIV